MNADEIRLQYELFRQRYPTIKRPLRIFARRLFFSMSLFNNRTINREQRRLFVQKILHILEAKNNPDASLRLIQQLNIILTSDCK